MTTRAFYVPRGITIDFSEDLDPALHEELISLRGQIHRGDPTILACGTNGLPLFIRRHPAGTYHACHFPGDNPDAHDHGTLRGMGIEHRRQTDYLLRSAESEGLRAIPEFSTGNRTRLDLAVFGAQQAGLEVQLSELSRAAAKRRARRSLDAGWPTAWITDRPDDPDWAYRVPTARLTVASLTRPINWAAAMPPPGTVDVVIDHFEPVRDSSTRRGWRLGRTPRAIYFDELPVRMAAGELSPVGYGIKDYVAITDKTSASLIEEFLHVGASQWSPKESEDAKRYKDEDTTSGITRPCRNPHTAHGGIATATHRQVINHRQIAAEIPPPANNMPPACPECGWRPWACFRDKHSSTCSRKDSP